MLPTFDKQQTPAEARGLSEKEKCFSLTLTFTKSNKETLKLLQDVYT
jgi:hypothetical protein